jgi:hypothetical protein
MTKLISKLADLIRKITQLIRKLIQLIGELTQLLSEMSYQRCRVKKLLSSRPRLISWVRKQLCFINKLVSGDIDRRREAKRQPFGNSTDGRFVEVSKGGDSDIAKDSCREESSRIRLLDRLPNHDLTLALGKILDAYVCRIQRRAL